MNATTKRLAQLHFFVQNVVPFYVAVIWSRIYKDHGDVNDIYVHAKKKCCSMERSRSGIEPKPGKITSKKTDSTNENRG